MPDLLLALALDLATVGVLVGLVYPRGPASRDFGFTCLMLNVVTFALVWVLDQEPLDLGLGLGLFALFGILRYRTEALRIRDLTYLFVAIGLAVIHAIEPDVLPWTERLILDGVIVGSTLILDLLRRQARAPRVPVTYDRLDLLHPDAHDALVADLHERLGMDCVSVDVREIDLLRETATLVVYLTPPARRATRTTSRGWP